MVTLNLCCQLNPARSRMGVTICSKCNESICKECYEKGVIIVEKIRSQRVVIDPGKDWPLNFRVFHQHCLKQYMTYYNNHINKWCLKNKYSVSELCE